MTDRRPPPKYAEVRDRLEDVDTSDLWTVSSASLERGEYRCVDPDRRIYVGPNDRLHHHPVSHDS